MIPGKNLTKSIVYDVEKMALDSVKDSIDNSVHAVSLYYSVVESARYIMSMFIRYPENFRKYNETR